MSTLIIYALIGAALVIGALELIDRALRRVCAWYDETMRSEPAEAMWRFGNKPWCVRAFERVVR